MYHSYFFFKLFLFSPKDIFIAFREGRREEGRYRNIDEREKHQLVASQCAPGPGTICTWTRDHTCSLGMCIEWESNLQPFSYRSVLQTTESNPPGPPQIFHPPIYWWALRLFPNIAYSKWCCCGHRGAYALLHWCFGILWIYSQKWICWVKTFYIMILLHFYLFLLS